jgi:hypothetical protein
MPHVTCANGRPHAPDGPPAANNQAAASPAARDAQGRFAPGNGGGPGNPFARRTADYRQAFADAITVEELGALARQLYLQALAGDLAAARLVLAYTIGKPAPAAEPDRLDVQELQLWQQSAVPADFVPSLVNQLPPTLALPLLQLAWPLFARQYTDSIRATLADGAPSADAGLSGEEESRQQAPPPPQGDSSRPPCPPPASPCAAAPSARPAPPARRAATPNGRHQTGQTAIDPEGPGGPGRTNGTRQQTGQTAADQFAAWLGLLPEAEGLG